MIDSGSSDAILAATRRSLAVGATWVALATGGLLASANAADGNPSPLAGFGVSIDANRRADSTMDRQIDYANVAKKGPRIIVLPGQIRSNNASFLQQVTPNNIADFGELELTRANFTVLDRVELGPMQREVELAYTMGDAEQARRLFQKGSLRSTKWIVKFDVLKAEQVATASSGFSGGAVAGLLGALGGSAGAALGRVAGSVNTNEAAGVWVVGLRYKILDANTTEQVASGYAEDKMEAGKTSSSVMGASSAASGQLTLDSLVQRLVQKSVAEIDARYK
ncbi:hypothetical protein [Piscinibacter sakaiensis]|uniref:hypothetical protein n=1 Tax=Piscinibacter sakaiensis TaxID=1547922 RepID=UPI003AACB054